MKKFVFMYVGVGTPSEESMKAWGTWFASIGSNVVDSGNPFVGGKEVTATGAQDLPMDAHALSGYSIVNAENIDEAIKLLQGCPMATSVRVYEARPM